MLDTFPTLNQRSQGRPSSECVDGGGSKKGTDSNLGMYARINVTQRSTWYMDEGSGKYNSL